MSNKKKKSEENLFYAIYAFLENITHFNIKIQYNLFINKKMFKDGKIK